MPKIWLTYAWVDNETQDVDYVISELQSLGIDVNYDRAELLAGERVWEQIDKAMNDSSVDGWAVYVTEKSLQSNPCREEIAIALDRAIRNKNSFPLIGIFPRPIDQDLIPSAIRTRLFVNLSSPDWRQQILSGLTRQKSHELTPPLPYGYEIHDYCGMKALEVWPRSGRWDPFLIVVPEKDGKKLHQAITGPRGRVPSATMTGYADFKLETKDRTKIITSLIDPNNSVFMIFTEIPDRIMFGKFDVKSTQQKLIVFGRI